MFAKACTTAAAFGLLSALAGAAQAQLLDTEILNNPLEAKIVGVNERDREITVKLTNGKTETLPVAADARLFTFDGFIERPRHFEDFNVGETVELEISGGESDSTPP